VEARYKVFGDVVAAQHRESTTFSGQGSESLRLIQAALNHNLY